MINKTPNNRWRVRVKSGGIVVGDKTFDLKRDATSWERDQKSRLGDGSWVDPERGKRTVANLVAEWLELRRPGVSSKTYQTEEYLLRKHTSKKFLTRPIASIAPSDVSEVLNTMLTNDLAQTSIARYRATLSGLFAYAVANRMVRTNPVIATKVPNGTGTQATREVYPFAIAELRRVYSVHQRVAASQADITLFLALTGLRWGELVSLRVRDVHDLPRPSVRVSRSGPDGHAIRARTKGGGPRSVPLAEELIPLVASRAAGKSPDELLFTAPGGGRLNGNNWKRAVGWQSNSLGRRVHDLRHTAATLWLYAGIDAKTVQTWLGHASMTLTVDLYGHFMGDDANSAGIARFNAALGDASGTRAKRRNASK